MAKDIISLVLPLKHWIDFKKRQAELRLLAVPGRLFCFGSLVVLDVVFRYLSLFLIDVKC